MFGLVLTGGGARGAYQAGVLRGIATCTAARGPDLPFKIISGTSAGAINAAFVASHGPDLSRSTERLGEIWSTISFSEVFHTETRRLTGLGLKWAGGLTFGGAGMKPAPNYLLDTRPLRALMQRAIPIERLPEYEARGGVLAVNATNYGSGAGVTFFSESARDRRWSKRGRVSRPAKLTIEHIMASAAIPLFFPPIRIGRSYFGDGAVRMKSPFSPAIHLGADKIIAIGVRRRRSDEETEERSDAPMSDVPLSNIAGVVLNSVFLDAFDADLERLERINRTLAELPTDRTTELRPISTLVFQPSVDIGSLAESSAEHFPFAVRYLLGGLGADGHSGGDLLSYLAFHAPYTRTLLEMGYQDAMARKDEIEAFLR